MKRKTLIISISVLLVVLAIAAAITVTLVVVLGKKHKDPEPTIPGPTLDDIISDNSTFPNGSYTLSVNALKPDLPALAPLDVNITMLNWLGLKIDNSSMIAETNRLSYFYVRLPQVINTNMSAKFETIDRNGSSIGIRFGNADTIHAVPLNLSTIQNSGLSYIGILPDYSAVYQLQVRMSNAMCSGSSVGSCSSVSWTPYSISSATSGSRADFSTELPVACGSQCNADASSPCATSCDSCDGVTVAGANTPVTRRYKMGSFAMSYLPFSYETYVVKDRVTVSYEGNNIFDSGCVGTNGERNTPLSYGGNSLEVRVDVEPNCDGTSSTGWYFQLSCGNCEKCAEYQCLDDSKAHCGPNGYLINYGLFYCNRYYQYYDQFTPAGQQFIDCARVKLMNYMEDYLLNVNGPVDCSDLKSKAFDSHVPIYYECGFCDVVCDNVWPFYDVLSRAFYPGTFWASAFGFVEETEQCVEDSYARRGLQPPPDCVAAFKSIVNNLTHIIG